MDVVGAAGSPLDDLLPVGVAQPQALEGTSARRPGHGERRRSTAAGVLDVEGQLEVGAARGVQLGERGDVSGQVGAVDLAMARRRTPAAHHAVVVEDRHAVGGEPDVALEAGGAQAQGQRERLEGVLGSVGARSAVSKRVGWRDDRWAPCRMDVLAIEKVFS